MVGGKNCNADAKYTYIPGGLVVKYPPANAGDTGDTSLIPGSGMISWERKWQPTPVFLPRESQGQRSLLGCCLWGHTE